MPHHVGSNEPLGMVTGRKFIAVLLVSVVTTLSVAANIKHYFADMDDPFFNRITQRFTASGSSRLAGARQRLLDRIDKPTENDTTALLGFVNDLFNRTPQVSDASHWGSNDYWSTPAELVASNGGDCEDFVIAKYLALRESGIPAEKLRMTYTKSFQGLKIENHMVLAYYPTPEAEPFLLDNIYPQMLLASKRPDLHPVYEFSGELSDRYSGTAMRKWDDLIQRMNKEFAS